MKTFHHYLLAAVCGLALVAGTGCPATTNDTDGGPTTTPDSGSNTIPDSGSNTIPDSGPVDAGPNCIGDGGCYACPPTTYLQIVNACTSAQYVDKNPTLPLLPDGGLPPLSQ